MLWKSWNFSKHTDYRWLKNNYSSHIIDKLSGPIENDIICAESNIKS